MSNSIQFTALSGARDDGCFCYLLEIDDAKILLDCGSTPWIDPTFINNLKRHVSVANQIDVILLSHSSLAHLGAYPYIYKHLGVQCPTFATLPVFNMGRITASYIYRIARKDLGSDISQSDVEAAFENITTLRYFQPTTLPGKCKDIIITAFGTGNCMGGSIWNIKKGSDEILYAVDYNHIRESHLEATSLLYQGQVIESMTKKALLITGVSNAMRILPTLKSRRDTFLEYIKNHTGTGGNVIVPVDCSSRVLEIIYIIERYMDSPVSFSKKPYNNEIKDIYFVSRFGFQLIRYAQSMLEWANQTLANDFSQNRKNPFELKHIKIVNSFGALKKSLARKYDGTLNQKPSGVVVLACGDDLDFSPSSAIFSEWCNQKSTLLLLTQRGSKGSLARTLYDYWLSKALNSQDKSNRKTSDTQKSADSSNFADVTTIPLGHIESTGMDVKKKSLKRVNLQGEELEAWKLEKLQIKKKENAKLALLLEEQRRQAQSSDDESETENILDLDESDAAFNSLDKLPYSATSFNSAPLSKYGNSIDGIVSKTSYLLNGNKNLSSGIANLRKSANANYENSLLHISDNLALSNFLNENSFDLFFDSYDSESEDILLETEYTPLRYQSFPFIEKRKKVSEYGEIIDVTHFKKSFSNNNDILGQKIRGDNIIDISSSLASKKGNLNSLASQKRSEDEGAMSDHSSSENEEGLSSIHNSLSINEPEIGYKYEVVFKNTFIDCKLTFVDLEGKSDSRSTRNIVTQLEPKRIVVIGADSLSTEYFCQSCATNERVTDVIFAPSIGQVINVSMRANAVSVRLADPLLDSLNFVYAKSNFRSAMNEVAKLKIINNEMKFKDGVLESSFKFDLFSRAAKSSDSGKSASRLGNQDNQLKRKYTDMTVAKLRGILRASDDPNISILELPNLEERLLFNDTYHVGDLKLSLLKRILLANGIEASFKGDGILTIGDTVTIEKLSDF
ncbi:hypothetical protein BB560_004421 [Smittium megazygosporum]|uniref:Cleavage and polyadenylation specificity factor subunit 2 n=1 Tax=Smittium megazygosporum TaxID=133381 RepID=A0A2T9Z9B7_9FUNG|nr:hypothetical protein BB560_004421 [Smittium megazygosporum]